MATDDDLLPVVPFGRNGDPVLSRGVHQSPEFVNNLLGKFTCDRSWHADLTGEHRRGAEMGSGDGDKTDRGYEKVKNG